MKVRDYFLDIQSDYNIIFCKEFEKEEIYEGWTRQMNRPAHFLSWLLLGLLYSGVSPSLVSSDIVFFVPRHGRFIILKESHGVKSMSFCSCLSFSFFLLTFQSCLLLLFLDSSSREFHWSDGSFIIIFTIAAILIMSISICIGHVVCAHFRSIILIDCCSRWCFDGESKDVVIIIAFGFDSSGGIIVVSIWSSNCSSSSMVLCKLFLAQLTRAIEEIIWFENLTSDIEGILWVYVCNCDFFTFFNISICQNEDSRRPGFSCTLTIEGWSASNWSTWLTTIKGRKVLYVSIDDVACRRKYRLTRDSCKDEVGRCRHHLLD